MLAPSLTRRAGRRGCAALVLGSRRCRSGSLMFNNGVYDERLRSGTAVTGELRLDQETHRYDNLAPLILVRSPTVVGLDRMVNTTRSSSRSRGPGGEATSAQAYPHR